MISPVNNMVITFGLINSSLVFSIIANERKGETKLFALQNPFSTNVAKERLKSKDRVGLAT